MPERNIPGLIQDPITARKAQQAAELAREREAAQLERVTITLSKRIRNMLFKYWEASEVPEETRNPENMTDEAIKEALRSVERDSTGKREARRYKLGVVFPVLTEDGRKDVKLVAKTPLQNILSPKPDKIRIVIPGQPHTFDIEGYGIRAVSRAEIVTRPGFPDSRPEYDKPITPVQAQGLNELLSFIDGEVADGNMVARSFGWLRVPQKTSVTGYTEIADDLRIMRGDTRTPLEHLRYKELERNIRENAAGLIREGSPQRISP